MPQVITQVRLNHPLFRVILSLKRVPAYLRFTVKWIARCTREWDALDQLDDQPLPDEMIFVGRLAKKGSMHLDRTVNGRRIGEWFQTADYEPVAEQPPDDVLRDNAKWAEWCQSRFPIDFPTEPAAGA